MSRATRPPRGPRQGQKGGGGVACKGVSVWDSGRQNGSDRTTGPRKSLPLPPLETPLRPGTPSARIHLPGATGTGCREGARGTAVRLPNRGPPWGPPGAASARDMVRPESGLCIRLSAPHTLIHRAHAPPPPPGRGRGGPPTRPPPPYPKGPSPPPPPWLVSVKPHRTAPNDPQRPPTAPTAPNGRLWAPRPVLPERRTAFLGLTRTSLAGGSGQAKHRPSVLRPQHEQGRA